jgi:hypothetical protein
MWRAILKQKPAEVSQRVGVFDIVMDCMDYHSNQAYILLLFHNENYHIFCMNLNIKTD